MFLPAVLNKKISLMSIRVRIGAKKGVGLSPAVGLEQKRVSAVFALSVWTKKKCRLSHRNPFGVKKRVGRVPAIGLGLKNTIKRFFFNGNPD